MQHLDKLRDSCLRIVLRVIVAPGNLQGWSSEELGSRSNRRLECDSVYASHVARDKQRIDVSVGIERSDMTP